ncbi:GSK3-beta interaction protein [Anopheles bellator]|uniref:GSK3-beta interaction protein n=1 Tax=Anopheles bellator TaxID=139047 RepID=UPI00264894F1|nr:GSK3-beta interaction protein [Anopheles bellator]
MENSIANYYAYSDEGVINWSTEASGMIKDIRNHVTEAILSKTLKATASAAFINITTIEGKRLCVKASAVGLQVVGDDYDKIDRDCPENMAYETPYALLTVESPSYVNSFGNHLADALTKHLREAENTESSENLSDVE